MEILKAPVSGKISTQCSIGFLSGTASLWYEMKWAWKSLYDAIKDLQVLKKQDNSKHTMCTDPSHDCKWLYLKQKRLARWSYHYHLPKFTRTKQLSVQTVQAISGPLSLSLSLSIYIYIYIYAVNLRRFFSPISPIFEENAINLNFHE